MKMFCVQLIEGDARELGARARGHRFYQAADEWKIQDGFVMFICHESSVPVFAIRADLVFSIEAQDDC